MSTPAQVPENDSRPSINPYAPTMAPIERRLPLVQGIESVSSIKLVISTVGCVAAAGGIFGFGLVVCISVYQNDPGSIPFALIGAPVGVVWALLGSVVVVPVSMITSFAVRKNDQPWSAQAIYLFGTICGFVTGFCCLAVPIVSESKSDLSDLLIALAPAVVGGIATPLMLIPLARLAHRAEQWAHEQALAAEQSEPN